MKCDMKGLSRIWVVGVDVDVDVDVEKARRCSIMYNSRLLNTPPVYL